MPRLLRVVFQLLPQPAHVNVNGAGQHPGFIAPNLAQQFIARKRSAALGDKVTQQLKLSRGEFDLLTVAKHLVAALLTPAREQQAWSNLNKELIG